MASTLKPLDPDMRQQLAQMLSGDAKAGSLRAQLVHGLLGSQTGDDSGLLGMTPLGAAFDVSAANRDRRQGGSGMAHTLSAAAGMIPGAGPEAHAALESATPEVVKAVQHLVDNFHPKDLAGDVIDKAMQDGNLSDLASKFGVDPHEAVQHPEILSQSMMEKASPVDLAVMHHDMQAHLGPDAIAQPVEAENAAIDKDMAQTPGAVGVRAQLEAALKGEGGMSQDALLLNGRPGSSTARSYDQSKAPPMVPKIVDAKEPPTVAGVKTSISDATKPGKVTPHSVDDSDHIAQVSGGDAKKMNFIKQSMQDEGGNVPEEVAQTLIDHAHQKGSIADLAHELDGDEATMTGDHSKLQDALLQQRSIPEMLAMHYDLDPETMGKAYTMPTKSSPTQ